MFDRDKLAAIGRARLRDGATHTIAGPDPPPRGQGEGIKDQLLDRARRRCSCRAHAPERTIVDSNTATKLQLCGAEYAATAHRHSHPLLGIFDAIAPAASAALTSPREGDPRPRSTDPRADVRCRAAIFEAHDALVTRPARLPGLAERAHRIHFSNARRMQSARSIRSYAEGLPPRGRRGLLVDPEYRSAARMSHAPRMKRSRLSAPARVRATRAASYVPRENAEGTPIPTRGGGILKPVVAH